MNKTTGKSQHLNVSICQLTNNRKQARLAGCLDCSVDRQVFFLGGQINFIEGFVEPSAYRLGLLKKVD